MLSSILASTCFVINAPPWRPVLPALSLQFSFKHGTFEKVNYLGYDDHVVLNRSISFLLGDENDGPRDQENAPPASAEGVRQERDGKNDRSEGGDAGGKLLTILTVSSGEGSCRCCYYRGIL